MGRDIPRNKITRGGSADRYVRLLPAVLHISPLGECCEGEPSGKTSDGMFEGI